jgi:hypothetical protein
MQGFSGFWGGRGEAARLFPGFDLDHNPAVFFDGDSDLEIADSKGHTVLHVS